MHPIDLIVIYQFFLQIPQRGISDPSAYEKDMPSLKNGKAIATGTDEFQGIAGS
jgi:hypothetical protein